MAKEFDPTLGYLMFFDGRGVYDADKGLVDYTEEEAIEHNKVLDKAYLEGLDQCPIGKGGAFYVCDAIVTWIGTKVADIESRFGPSTGRTVRFKRNGMEFKGKYDSNNSDLCFFKRTK